MHGTDALTDEGLAVRGQFPPRPMGVLYGLDPSYHPFSLNPSYRPLADLPLAEKVARMRDPEPPRASWPGARGPNPAFRRPAELLKVFSPFYNPAKKPEPRGLSDYLSRFDKGGDMGRFPPALTAAGPFTPPVR